MPDLNAFEFWSRAVGLLVLAGGGLWLGYLADHGRFGR